MREPGKYLPRYREKLAECEASGDEEGARIQRALIARLEKEIADREAKSKR